MLGPKTKVSRPITDRVKESLFDVLGNKYDLPEGKVAADLFSGVGSLGLEALSRGAEFVTFVEADRKVVATLQRNIDKAGFVRESKVITASAFKVGAPVDFGGRKYELVFVDPPYAKTSDVSENSALGKLLEILGEQVAEGGIVTVRTEQHVCLLERYGRFTTIERRKWGTMAVTILQQGGG